MAKQSAGGGMDMSGLIRQAQGMQRNMARLQEELRERIVEGQAAGGVVRVQAAATKEIVGIRIDPDAVDEDDLESLEDLLIVAVNDALKQADAIYQKEMQKVTGGLNLPGIT